MRFSLDSWIAAGIAACALGFFAMHALAKEPAALRPPPLWTAPRDAIDLTALRAKVDAPGGGSQPAPPFRRWNAKQIREQWTQRQAPTGALFISPVLSASQAKIEFAEISVRVGKARSLRFMPRFEWPDLPEYEGLEATDLRYRTISVPLGSLTSGDEIVDFVLPIREVLYGNWGDQRGTQQLSWSFAIAFDAPDARVLSATLVDEHARLAVPGERATRIERGGVIRTAWSLGPGARSTFDVALDDTERELRWYDGADGPVGARTVRVIDDEGSHLIGQSRGGGPWRLTRASLARWKGQRVGIEFSVQPPPATPSPATQTKPGVGYFGTPEIVPSQPAGSAPDVIVYLIDTLRADRLGAWGHTAARTPHIDRLAQQGVVFRNAISSSPWTKPAIPTLMSGIWPTTHRVGAASHTDLMPPGVELVQERFHAAGWRTASFSANPLGSTLSGLGRGFGAVFPPRHWQGSLGERNYASASQLHESLFDFLEEQPDRPAMTFVQTLEVHEWRNLKKPEKTAAERYASYDAAVARADAEFGSFVERLRAMKRKRPTMIVLVSDHGESLGEHRWVGHGYTLYQTEVHIPLVFWSSDGWAARSIQAPVSLADVAPTLLELFQLEPFSQTHGESLAPAIHGQNKKLRSYAPSALLRFVHNPGAPKQFSLIDNSLNKAIRWDDGRQELYDLTADPQERAPVAKDPSGMVATLANWLDAQSEQARAFKARHGATQHGPLDPAQLERLRSLGYVGD